ncbi:hypothetical protein [Trueperella pyogenes]
MNKKIISILVALIGGFITFLTIWGLNCVFPTDNSMRTAPAAAATVAALSGVLFFIFSRENKE